MTTTDQANSDVLDIRAYIESKIRESRNFKIETGGFQELEQRTETIGQLLEVQDDDLFIRLAYLKLLGRNTDIVGLKSHSARLMNGDASRSDILFSLIRSAEAKQFSSPLKGIRHFMLKMRLSRALKRYVRPIWWAYDFTYSLVNSRSLAQKMTREAFSLQKRMQAVEKKLIDVLDFNYSLKFKQPHQSQINSSLQQDETKTAQNSEKTASADSTSLTEFINEFFVELSERFRGSEADILNRNSLYKDVLLKRLNCNISSPVLDIACGRGEMLHIIKEAGLHEIGIDLNDIQIAYCKAKSLNVFKSDALGFLRNQPDNSLGAISSTHFVEHLKFDYLVEMLREAYRAVKPGGGIIIETPNPSNLVVSTIQFYMDPSHRNPIPMNLMELLLEKIGFRVEPIDLSQRTGNESLGTVEHPQLNHMLNSPQDYALLGIKPL